MSNNKNDSVKTIKATKLVNELLNSRDEPSVVLDRNYVIVAANKSYEALHQFKVDGKSHCYEISHHYKRPCDLEGENCPLKACLQNNASQRALHIHHTQNGTEHVDVTLSPIRDETGEIEYFIESTRPIKCASTNTTSDGLVGRSLAFNTVLEMIQRVACSDVNVLLQGESGTGKELIAEAIHNSGVRKQGPFVAVDCSGLTESLFESELFGHEKGAFTGAYSKKAGLAEAANGGTLFLDEIGDISLNLQTKLLRLIETGTFRRVGGLKSISTNFRLISASHKNLVGMVQADEFRNDLYYRLSAFPLHIPSLRERVDDIPLLADSLLKRYYPDLPISISEEALATLQTYNFPGNIRELSNIIQRASLMVDDEVILTEHLPDECKNENIKSTEDNLFSKIIPLKELERQYLDWAESQVSDKKELSKKLGVSERTLYRKLQ